MPETSCTYDTLSETTNWQNESKQRFETYSPGDTQDIHEKTTCTFHYTGFLKGILVMAYYHLAWLGSIIPYIITLYSQGLFHCSRVFRVVPNTNRSLLFETSTPSPPSPSLSSSFPSSHFFFWFHLRHCHCHCHCHHHHHHHLRISICVCVFISVFIILITLIMILFFIIIVFFFTIVFFLRPPAS